MKKLFLVMFSFLLFVGFALAQNNTSTLYQKGTDNEAFVNQTGLENLSDVIQRGVNVPGSGIENLTFVDQWGRFNQGFQIQDGDNNEMDLDQMGRSNYSFQQTGVGWAQFNLARVYQEGRSNSAEQQQRYDNNLGDIYQKGEGNDGYQFQNAIPNMSPGNTAYIDQIGMNNSATQLQKHDFNYAESHQRSEENESWQDQEGTDNYGYVDQGYGWKLTNNSYAEQYQRGIGNEARSYQHDGYGHEAYQTQYGESNWALTHTDGYDNYSWQFQDGLLNRAEILQNYEDWHGENGAMQHQEGEENDAYARQKNGNNNWSEQWQFGALNIVDHLQDGFMNTALTEQYGVGHNHVETQIGNGNFSHTVQSNF